MKELFAFAARMLGEGSYVIRQSTRFLSSVGPRIRSSMVFLREPDAASMPVGMVTSSAPTWRIALTPASHVFHTRTRGHAARRSVTELEGSARRNR